MTLRLDPRRPLVWRDPDTLQIGVDPPLVVLDRLTLDDERAIAALAVGVTREGLEVLAQGDVDGLLTRLEPALRSAPAPVLASVAVSGAGRLADRISELLRDTGHDVRRADEPRRFGDAAPDIAVIVGDWVLAPELHSYWLRRDTPHLPVVASDTAVHVGPLIEPGAGPCLLCLELHRRDGDVAWPAIATQLLGRGAGVVHPALVAEVAAAVVRAIETRLASGAGVPRSVRLGEEGGRSEHEWAPHPECGCRGIAHLVAPARPRSGSDSPDAATAPVLPLPTTARVADALA